MKAIKINTFYPDASSRGGRLINKRIFSVMGDIPGIAVNVIDKSNLRAPRWRFWNVFSILQYRKLTDCNYFFVDSKDLCCNMKSFFFFVRVFFKRIGFITIVHQNSDYLFERNRKYKISRDRRVLKKCDYVITVSPYIFNNLVSYIDKEKLRYIPLPFDTDCLETSSYEKGKLLYVGSVNRCKGIDYLIDALTLINDEVPFTLDIVGLFEDTDYENKLKSRLVETGLDGKVSLSGKLDPYELKEKYKSSYCFVFPSLTEGFGMVIMEAMSFGLPVIAFDNTAIPYTVHNGENGILCRNKDVNEFAEAIRKMLTDREFHGNCSIGALKTASNASSYIDFERSVRSFANELIRI